MDKIRALVDIELGNIEDKLRHIIDPENEILSDLNKFIDGKSKRVRSILSLLYLKANNVFVNDDIIVFLTAVELIHNASLLHDDVIDSSSKRRGEESFYSKYGSKISVLLGDLILSAAVELILSLNNPAITNIILNTTKKMSYAEISQFLLRNRNISFEEYIEVIQGKTASLFSGVMECSAILGNLEIEKAKLFGNNFGLVFQINNDLQVDSAAEDKKNGIKTITNILGIEKTQNLKDNYKEELRKMLSRTSDNEYKQGLEDLIELL